MREYLFRAKRDGSGKWVTGYFTYFWVDGVGIARIERANGSVYGHPVDYIEVDVKTVGQFTGLTDKNGKKIFEGDLIKICTPRYCAVRKVAYSGAQFVAVAKDGGECDFQYITDIEVIGNIYDNPDKFIDSAGQ